MIDYTDIDARLREYSEAFDYYILNGTMPPHACEDDCIIEYLQHVIDADLLSGINDPLWIEALKDNLFSFLAILLGQLKALQLEVGKELAAIARFKEAPLEHKLTVWKQVCDYINDHYTEDLIDMSAYIEQAGMLCSEPVMSAMASDWEYACKDKYTQRLSLMLKQAKNSYQHRQSHAAVNQDYQEKRQLEEISYQYPQLAAIVDIIGRDKDSAVEEEDSIIYKYLPVKIAKNSSVDEIDRVVSGDNLERVLPVEFSVPEDLFFKRYATKQLQQFSCPGKDKPQKTEEHRQSPRLTKGPIIVCVDTSPSMEGQPVTIAFALLRQLLNMAKKQHRSCYLITFAVQASAIDLAAPRNWNKLDRFLSNTFSGGTDGEQMLSEALRALHTAAYEMADVLIISDLEFPAPKATTILKIDREKALGTRFYALQIGGCRNHPFHNILDRIWTI